MDSVDLIGSEPAPMLTGGIIENDGRLQVSERLYLLQCCPVLRHVDHAVLDALGVERPVSSVALDASRLCVDSEQNVSF